MGMPGPAGVCCVVTITNPNPRIRGGGWRCPDLQVCVASLRLGLGWGLGMPGPAGVCCAGLGLGLCRTCTPIGVCVCAGAKRKLRIGQAGPNPWSSRTKPLVKPDQPLVKPDQTLVKPDKPLVKPDQTPAP